MVKLFLDFAIPLLWLAGLLSGALALFAWKRRTAVPGTWAFALLMLAVAEWALGYALELWSQDLNSKLLWTYLRSLGMATGPVLWLIFALYYAGRGHWLSGRRLGFLLSLPLPFLLLIFTNSWHHLTWRDVELVSSGPLSVLRYDLGPAYWVAVAYAYLCVLLGSAFIIQASRECHLYRWQAGILVTAASLPLVSHVVTLVWGARTGELNLAPFAFALSGLFIAINTYGFRFLEIMPIAHRIVIENIQDGVIVLDIGDCVVSLNPAAERILGRTADEVIGRPVGEALAAWPALGAALADENRTRDTICLPGVGAPRYYDLTVSPLWNQRGRLGGRLVVLRDVTERWRSEEALARRFEQIQAMRKLTEAVNRAGALQQIYETALDGARQVLRADRAAILLLDPDRVMRFKAWYRLSETYRRAVEGHAPWPLDDSDPQPVLIPDVGQADLGSAQETVVAEGIGALGFIPLVYERRLLGKFMIYYDTPHPFPEDEIHLAQTFADTVASALERKRVEERLHRLATVTAEVTGSLDLTRVLDAIASSVLELVQATDVHIYLYDQEKDEFTFGTALWEDGRRMPAVTQVRQDGLTATVARSGQRVVINDTVDHPLFADSAARAWGIKSIAGFPLRRADRVVGVLNVAFLHQHHRFTRDELRVLSLLADQAAIAIENARLVEAERQARQQAETLQEVARVLSSVLEPAQLLELVLQELEKLVPYDSASVMLIQGEILRVVAARNFPETARPFEVAIPAVDDPFLREVTRTRGPVILEDAQKDSRFRSLGGTGYVRGWICAPLLVRDQVIGLLTVDSRKPGAYDEEHARVVQTFAHHAAIAIENARLHEEIRHQAVTDGLTQLYNRRYLYEMLDKELVRSQRYHRTCSLIMLDLDDFKHYNDRYGHLAGDDLLRELAVLIRSTIRQPDMAARYGGEEFVLVLPETGLDQALALAERLRKVVREHGFVIRGEQQVGRITVSLGVATYPTHAEDVEGLIQAADRALLRSKTEGKDRVYVAGETP